MTTAFDKDLELIFQKLTSDRQVKQALDFLKQDAPNTIAQQKELRKDLSRVFFRRSFIMSANI